MCTTTSTAPVAVVKPMTEPRRRMVVQRKRKSSKSARAFPIGVHKFVTIRKHGGKPKVNIRDYTSDGHGDVYATKRGIMLSLEEWTLLKEQISTIDTALAKRLSLSYT